MLFGKIFAGKVENFYVNRIFKNVCRILKKKMQIAISIIQYIHSNKAENIF